MGWRSIGREEVTNMGRGRYKKNTTVQKKSHNYVAQSSSNQAQPSTRKSETVLSKTKGYDELQRKDKERRGRKKEK